jgi:hypothetical protein
MRKTPPDVERQILFALLNGESYQDAGDGNDVGKATVNRIVEDAREKIPDFDDLRELKIRLNRYGLSVSEVLQSLENQEQEKPDISYIYSIPNEENEAVKYLKWTLENKTTTIACKNCYNQFQIPLETWAFYNQLIRTGQSLPIICPYCRYQSWYTPFEILGFFGGNLLQRDVSSIKIYWENFW